VKSCPDHEDGTTGAKKEQQYQQNEEACVQGAATPVFQAAVFKPCGPIFFHTPAVFESSPERRQRYFGRLSSSAYMANVVANLLP
jgi:hypothetical protein